jgi:putative cardiolipin synthase
MKRISVCLSGLLFLSACATLPKNFPATVSTAIPQSERTTLGELFKDDVAKHKGFSGFHLLNTGPEAFRGRIALAELA